MVDGAAFYPTFAFHSNQSRLHLSRLNLAHRSLLELGHTVVTPARYAYNNASSIKLHRAAQYCLLYIFKKDLLKVPSLANSLPNAYLKCLNLVLYGFLGVLGHNEFFEGGGGVVLTSYKFQGVVTKITANGLPPGFHCKPECIRFCQKQRQ